MKKIYVLLSIVALSFAAKAQNKGNIEFGLNVGYSISTVYSDNHFYDSPDSYNGVNFGASADFYFSDRWSIKVKALYDKKGFNRSYVDIPEGQILTDVRLNYITVPVMANWHFGHKRNWYLNFGPYVGFLTNAKETRFNNDLKNQFNTTDAGLAFGIGVKIPLSDKLKLFFEFDDQEGFSDIMKNNNYDDFHQRVTNSRGSFNIGINFLL